MTLDFTTLTAQELQAYFNEGDLRHAAGYSDYEKEFRFQNTDHFKTRLSALLSQGQFNRAMSVLELGGARGHRAKHALQMLVNIKSWEIIDIHNSPLKKSFAELTYTIGDANALMADTTAYKSNSKDVVLSFRFLDCIPDAKLPALIANMNRVAKIKQFHVISPDANPEFYSNHDLSWWAGQGFTPGTILITHKDFQRGIFENAVVV